MRQTDDAVSILHTVAATLNQVPDVREAMTRILPRLTRALGLHTAWMFLLDERGMDVAEVTYTGLPPALYARRARPLKEGSCHCQDSFRQGELTRAVNIVRCSRLQKAAGDRGELVFHASVPLLAKDRRLGILNVASPGRELFSADVLRVLSAVGQQVAVAVERSGLYRQASRRAELLEALEQAAARLHRLHTPESVAREVVDTLVKAFGCGTAALFVRVDRSFVPLAHAGRGTPPPAASGAITPPGRVLPGEAFHPGGADPAILTIIPGSDPPDAILSAAVAVSDPFTERLFASYGAHIGLSLTNAALLARQTELGALLERERLARELHDAISQRLFSSALDLAALSEEIPAGVPMHALVESAATHTRAALQEMRELVYELTAPRVGPLGPLLRALAPHSGVVVQVDADPPLPEVSRMALLRIAQEAVQNALRHAPGALVTLSLRSDPEALILVVEDDGPGFALDRAPSGLGLGHMHERAQAAGAELTVDTEPGRGCRVRVRLPQGTAGASPS